MYDVLRADRCISANSIEARVPFGDLDFVRYVMAIDPEKKLNSYGKGKYLLRKAFEATGAPRSCGAGRFLRRCRPRHGGRHQGSTPSLYTDEVASR